MLFDETERNDNMLYLQSFAVQFGKSQLLVIMVAAVVKGQC